MKKYDAWLGKSRLHRCVNILLLSIVTLYIDSIVFHSLFSRWTIYSAQHNLALMFVVLFGISVALSWQELKVQEKLRRRKEQEEVEKAAVYLSGEMAEWK